MTVQRKMNLSHVAVHTTAVSFGPTLYGTFSGRFSGRHTDMKYAAIPPDLSLEDQALLLAYGDTHFDRFNAMFHLGPALDELLDVMCNSEAPLRLVEEDGAQSPDDEAQRTWHLTERGEALCISRGLDVLAGLLLGLTDQPAVGQTDDHHER